MGFWHHWFDRIGQLRGGQRFASMGVMVLIPLIGLVARVGVFALQQSADLHYGDTVNGKLVADGTQDWHFVAARGDMVGVHIVRASSDLVAGMTLQDSDGQPLVSAQAANTGDLTLANVPIVQPGAYTIHVFSVTHTAGGYQLTLTNTVTTTALPTPIAQAAAGTVQYGLPVQGHIDGQTYQQFWRLTGTVGDVIDVQMRVLSGDLNSAVSLQSPAGDVITASATQSQPNSTSRDAAIYSVQLPRTGNYTILARRSGDQQGRTGTTSGTYMLTVTVHTVALGAADSILTPGDTLTGHLTTAAPISQYRVESGGILAFRLALGSLHRIARVRLLDSAGIELLVRDGLSPLAFSIQLPPKGPFFVQVTSDSYEAKPATDFALSVYKISALSAPLHDGEAQHGLTPAGNTPDHWFFVGHSGDLIRLRLTPDADALNATLTFSGPQDSILFHGMIGPAFDQPFSLPADGAYQIAVQSIKADAAPFGYQLAIEPFGVRSLPFATAGVTSSKGVLAFDKLITGTLTPASDDTYTLDANAGQSLNVTVMGQTAAQSLGVLIRAPDESLVAVQTGTGAARLHRAILPVNGRYTVIVFDPGGAASSPYTLQLEDAGGGILSAEQSVKGVLLPSDSMAEWSLDAPAGALLNARLSTRTPAAWTPGLYVVDPAGFVLAHASIGLDKTTLALAGITAPVTGRYRFVVAGTVGAAFASYELLADVQTPFAAGTGPAVPITTPPPAARFAPAPGTPIPAPPLADLIDPPLPLDTAANVVQPLPLNIVARGEIAPGTLRQIWRVVSAAGNTLAIRAVTLDGAPNGSAHGPDLALFEGATGHIVAEQLHGDTADTILTYYSAQGGAYFLAARLGLGSGRYTLYAAAQLLTQGALQIKQGLPLGYGQTAFGELLPADQSNAYYFYGVVNDVINLSAARVTGDLSPGLALTPPSGPPLAVDANKSSSANAALGSLRLPETGVYTLQVRHADPAPQSAGRYLLSLGLVSGSRIKNRLGGLLSPGRTVTGALLPIDYQNTWLLAGQAGDHISLVVSGLSASDAPTPLSLQLQDTAGHPFAQADIQLPQDTARLTDVLLPNDGIYRVQITGGSQTQGGYQLTWLPASDSGQLPGAIRYGQTISGLFTTTQRADKYTFAGTTGDVIALSLRDVRGDPFRGGFQLLSAGGVALATAADVGNGEGARIDGLTLPLTGTYTIVVANTDAAFKGTGVYALGLTLQDSKARGMGGLLRDGDHSGDELYPDDPLHTWLFAGRGGDVVNVQVTAGDHFLQPEVTLQTPSGQALAHATGDANGNASIASFKLPANGVYTLAVTGANHTAGSYRIGLTFAPPPASALATINYGGSAVGLIADDRPTDLYLFNGRQGDRISVKATRESGSTLALTLELQTGFGDLLARADALGNDTAALNGFVLPATGTYRIVVSRFGGAAGRTAGRLTVALDGQPANFTVRGKLTPGQSVLGRLDDATPADRWTFVGKAGQVISLTSTATSGDLDTFLTLQAPDGSTLATNDDFDGTNAVLPGVPLRIDGPYTVILSRVGTRGLGSAGNYVLRLDTLFTLGATAVPQAVIGYGQRVVGTLDVAHAVANWTFAAEQGDEIGVLLVHPTDDAPPLLSVQDPSGAVLATGTLHVGQTTIDSYRVPTRGLFNLTVKRPLNARAAYSPYALTLTLLGSPSET
ncbi:MAG: PPC domain-containing protein, partial [Aggregatilineales bacterium]